MTHEALAPKKEREPIPGSIGLVFSGQGLNSRKSLYEHISALWTVDAPVVATNIQLMEDVSGLPLSEYIADQNEFVLGRTDVVQTMIHGLHLSVIEMLKPILSDSKQIKKVAGHSAGEIAAMVASGVLTPEDSAVLMAKRGDTMHRAALEIPSELFYVIGFDRNQTREVIEDARRDFRSFRRDHRLSSADFRYLLQLVAGEKEISEQDVFEELKKGQILEEALLNEPGITVVGGTKLATCYARALAKIKGGRRIMVVDAEAAFHTPALAPAVPEFSEFFRRITLNRTKYPVVLNSGVETMSAETMQEAHVDRMTHPSVWTQAMEHFGDIETVVKIGPNGVVPGVSKNNGIAQENQVAIADFLKSR